MNNMKLIICLFGLLCISTAITCPEGCETCEKSKELRGVTIHNYCTQCLPGFEFDTPEEFQYGV